MSQTKRFLKFAVLSTVCFAAIFSLVSPPEPMQRSPDNNLYFRGANPDVDRIEYKIFNDARCGGGDTLVMVASKCDNFSARNAHRRAFNDSVLRSLGIKRIFLLGLPETARLQDWIDEEDSANADILQGEFQDLYRNLPLKHLMGLSYSSRICPEARLIIKLDDDIAVDLMRFRALVLERRRKSGHPRTSAYGMVQFRLPVQRNYGKWALTDEEFDGGEFPNFLSGWGYATTPEAAGLLARAAATEKMLWIDDAWITGVLGRKVGLNLVQLNRIFTVYREHVECCSEEEGVACDYVVGPTGSPEDLVRFARHSIGCWDFERNVEICRKSEEPVAERCRVENPLFLPEGKGVGQVL